MDTETVRLNVTLPKGLDTSCFKRVFKQPQQFEIMTIIYLTRINRKMPKMPKIMVSLQASPSATTRQVAPSLL